MLGRDLAIDLGTANVLVYVRGEGIVINEPSTIAFDKKTGDIVAIGSKAKNMKGKTPDRLKVVKPLVEGIISDFDATEKMLRYFIKKAQEANFSLLSRPQVVIGIPSNATEMEREAVKDAAKNASARNVVLMEEPLAAAVGSDIDFDETEASLIIDIGGGTCEIAVVSCGGVVLQESLKVAGDRLNRDIIEYVRSQHQILIGEESAEDIKISIGVATDKASTKRYKVKGRGLTDGLPKQTYISQNQAYQAIENSLASISEEAKEVLQQAPPEVVSDIIKNKVVLTGGGALLDGMDERISDNIDLPVKVADDPFTSVVRGMGKLVENNFDLEKVFSIAQEQVS